MEPSSTGNSGLSDLLLVNPAAGGGRSLSVLSDVRRFARDRGWNVEISVTESPDDLAAKARQAAAAGRQRILVLGGDGTFQLLVNALACFPDVILGVIPAGGGNDLAAALGLPSDPLRAASLLLDGEVSYLDAVRVRTSDGNERLYTGGGGVGLDAEASRYASGAYRNLHGRLRYLLAAIRAVLGFQAFPVRLQLSASDPLCVEATALLVGVLNTPSYGAGLCLAPAAKPDDGMLELVVLEDLNFLEILALLPALAIRGKLNTRHIRRYTTQHVRIETPTPSWFHGDGELLGKTPVEISVMPKAVRVLRSATKQKN